MARPDPIPLRRLKEEQAETLQTLNRLRHAPKVNAKLIAIYEDHLAYLAERAAFYTTPKETHHATDH